jgi:L-fuculose-phosphate aldolase
MATSTINSAAKQFFLMHPREQLAEIMQRIYQYSMTTTSGGNLSLIDSEGNMWITPAGIDKGKLTADDMICITKEQKIIGRHKPSSEYPFHQKIYARNPEIKSILHAHPPALSAFSIIRNIPETKIFAQAINVCGKVEIAKYATPGTDELADYISEAFKKSANIVILENHGVVTAGETILEAFQRFETLEFCARTILNAKALGEKINTLSDEQINTINKSRKILPDFNEVVHSNKELELRKEICEFSLRAYNQRLMISTGGTISARVSENSFLITPYGVDRKYLNAENIVLIKDGKKETGKNPSRAALLHQEIYKNHPEVKAIITAQAPNIMAYGITNKELDTRTIPENYILLKKIPSLELNSDANKISKSISSASPVIIIQNDAVLAVGPSLLKAYDRLEVAERAAETVINSIALGNFTPLNKEQLADLDKNFG